MNHLDEGTIHAWLDGALDATQARDVESHLAACTECSAAVAEARGLIAGASRILTALDDVPAGVIPKGASAAPVVTSTTRVVRAQPQPQPRPWRAARWVTGIAAALMLAIGVTTWNKGAVKEMTPAERLMQAPKLDTAAIALTSGEAGVRSLVPPSSTASAPSAPSAPS